MKIIIIDISCAVTNILNECVYKTLYQKLLKERNSSTGIRNIAQNWDDYHRPVVLDSLTLLWP